MTGPEAFHFHNVERQLARAGDWNRSDWPKLWLYNAHYFDDLAADDEVTRLAWHRRVIERWIAENPPGKGVGWEPYPTSLRVVNWLKWLLAGNEPVPGMLHSLAVQVRWLRGRLERHLLGNHLWANAKALVFAGVCFKGGEAAIWLRQGLDLMRREVAEQILPDGGHFERSPMYHAILTEDVLDLIQLGGLFGECAQLREFSDMWKCKAIRMLRWLEIMTHPDGQIAFFNDAAFGIAPRLSELQQYAKRVGVCASMEPLARIELLSSSGFLRLQTESAVLICDVGSVGPSYLPGHAHAGTLSFELSVFGKRVLVNGGISTYEVCEARELQRGTLSHNTVVVGGANSSDVWGSFRVGRRATAKLIEIEESDGYVSATAEHDGYRRLFSSVVHRRTWKLGSNWIEVGDNTGNALDARAIFRFSPCWSLELLRSEAGKAVSHEGEVVQWSAGREQKLSIKDVNWYPGFGREERSSQVEVSFSREANFTLCWPR